MKNIFSKTSAEKRTQNGVKSYLCPTFVLSPILIFAFLTLGVGQAWADYQGNKAGFWKDGGVVLTWNKNGGSATTTLNYNGESGNSLGDITTGLSLTSSVVHFWREYAYGNICESTIYWELYKSTTKIASGNYSPASWGSWDGNNNTMTYSTSQDFFAKTTGPGNYTIRIYAKLTGQSSDSKYDDPSYLGCGTSWWYNRNTTNGYYSITFTIPSKDLTIAGAADGNTVSGSVSGVTKGTAYTITATPTAGYAFNGWTKTSGDSSITIADASSATTTVTFNDYSNDATVTANFVAEETHDITVSYECGTGTIKEATTESAVGVTTARNITAPAISGFTFSGWTIGDGVKNNSGSTTANPININSKGSGDYTLTANYTCDWELRGSMDSWGSGYSTTATNATTVYADVTLSANTDYSFKFMNGSTWYGVTGAVTNITYTNKGTARAMTNTGDGSPNQTMTSAGAGTYRFTWDITNKKVTITYPTSYTVELEVGTVKGNANTPKIYHTSATAGNEVTSGKYVAEGTKVIFWVANSAGAAPKAGYNWWGFYNNAAGTGSGLPEKYTDNTVSVYTINSIAANAHVYAVFGENNYTVKMYNNGNGDVYEGGSIVTSTTAHVATASNTLTATPQTGYYFTGWDQFSDSLTINSPSTASTTIKIKSNKLGNNARLRANYSPQWSVIGTGAFGGWSAYNTNLFTGYTVVSTKDVGYKSITLAANTSYEIKVYDRLTSTSYGGSAVQTIDYAHSGAVNEYTVATTSSPQSVVIQSAAGGTYTLNWNLTDKKIAVVYPTSRFITTGQKTTGQADNAGGSFTAVDNASNNVYGGKFVANNATVTFTATPNTGYNFVGWYSDASCETAYVNGTGGAAISGEGGVVLTLSSITADKTIYAKFTPKNYNVALNMQSGAEGYGSGSDRNETVTYNTTLTTVGSLPTAANGYAFMGFYTATGGRGTQFIDASGNWETSVTDTISDGKWVRDAGATLYAYYKKAEITNVAISPSTMVAPATELTITPTVSPTPTGTTKLCYYVLHNGGSMVDPQPAMTLTSTNAKLTLPGTSGTYKIAVTLRTGSSCGGGTLIDSVVTNVVIASDHTVTIKYLCDGEPVKASTTISGKPLAWSSSFMPGDDPFGYTFVEWRAGDGVTISTNGSSAISGTTTTTRTIYIKANYDGVLTAVYRQRGIIYFKKPSDWSGSSSVYYYNIGSSGKWKDSGEGKYGLYTNDITYGGQAMTRIGTSNIYYYDYEATGTTSDDPGQYIAFSNQLQNGYQPMTGCQVSWPIEYTKGFNTGTPMFVCANYRYHQWLADYYNGGYWTKYHPDWSEDDYTGYTLKIYNQKASSGRKELKSVKFTSTSENMTYKAVVELEAGQTYGFKFVRDDGMYYKNDKDGTYTYSSRNDYWPFVFDGSDGDACGLRTTATGNYTFTMAYYEDSHDIRINVSYPIANNDYRLIYKDDIHIKWHPSANISKRNNAKDTVSFFVRKDKNPIVKIQTASVNASTGAVTWNDYTGGNLLESIPSVISDKSDYGVYNFNLQTNSSGAMSLESIDEYTGEYYIRTDNVTNKWDSYKNADHMMTYTEFSENRETNTFGPLYSHYFCHWCECGTNIKFTIANDYSPCISDTLTAGEFANTDASGTLKTDSDPATDNTSDIYSANIRFMWNRKTNEIGRAYVASATTAARQFLVLKGCNTIKNSDGSSLSGTGESAAENRAIFKDNQDWIYERMIQIQPGTHAKLYACYAKNPIDVSTAQYFRGAYDSGNCSNEESSTNSIQIIGGSGSSFYVVRVIYDFKTNRLITAWMPNGTDITSNVEVDADVMVIRDHQDAAECITFSESGKLSKVKTVYGVMRFNRWTLNNRYRGLGGVDDQNPDHCSSASAISTYHGVLPTADQKSSHERGSYFVSFPFDVKLSEVFGFGTYGTHWIISTYNGARRAQRGFFYDNCVNEDCTNWDYVIESEGYNPKTFVMEKYKGYLLQLDLDLMEYDNTAFWTNNISQKELYFPSQVAMESITSTEATMPALDDEQYLCTINHDIPKGSNPEGDRRMKDSYWRCIGVPSYATYGAVLKKDNSSGATITWNSDRTWKANVKNYPFLYEWNPEDNTISVRATSRYEFKPMHAYLVQNGNAIYWSAVSATPASIVRRVYEEEDKEYLWEIELQYNNKVADRTYLRLSNDELITDTFDLNQDLIKEFNNSRSNIYTLIGIEKVAANSRTIHSEETTTIPLGLVIKTAGDYTIAIPDGTNGVGITLIDEETGIRTSLSALDYTVELAAGDYTERFWLEISPVKGAETGMEEVTGDGLQVTGPRKVMIDGILYIVKDGKMFDATGKRVE